MCVWGEAVLVSKICEKFTAGTIKLKLLQNIYIFKISTKIRMKKYIIIIFIIYILLLRYYDNKIKIRLDIYIYTIHLCYSKEYYSLTIFKIPVNEKRPKLQ